VLTTTTNPTTTISDHDAQQLGAHLFAAFESGHSIEPLTDARPGLSVDDAYRIQRALLGAHTRAGRAVVGRKIGLTSLAMQRQLGIDSPDFGFLLDSHVWSSGIRLSRSALHAVALRIEPEIALVLKHELRGPRIDLDSVLAATEAILPVFELIDSRVRDWRIRLSDTIADNASSLGAVLGESVAPGAVGELAAVEVRLSRDGEMLQEGTGAAVMGNPAAAVAWLANELGRFGEPLPAGQPILAGSFTAAVDATPGRYEASFGPVLGSVGLEVVD
jgi:2-keto-4-pentenoate hydratase